MNTQHDRPSTPMRNGRLPRMCIADVDRGRVAARTTESYDMPYDIGQGALDSVARS